MVSTYHAIPVNRDEFYPGFICNKENAFYKDLKARKTAQNGGRKVILLLIVHVILFNMLFQLHRTLFSCAVYIKTQSDVFVTILEDLDAPQLLQTPFWIVCSMRSSVHFIPVDRDIPDFHVYMNENSSRLAGIPVRRDVQVNRDKT